MKFESFVTLHITNPVIVKFLSKKQHEDLGSYISSNLYGKQATHTGQLRHKKSRNCYPIPLIVTTGCQFVLASINSGLIDLSYRNGNKESMWHR